MYNIFFQKRETVKNLFFLGTKKGGVLAPFLLVARWNHLLLVVIGVLHNYLVAEVDEHGVHLVHLSVGVGG